jgi:succinoglycan biosynthesis protein ExoA
VRPHRILHLRASNFVGGPEHQLLRYAEAERTEGRWDILLGTFTGPAEGADFLKAIEAHGLPAVPLPASSWSSALKSLIQTMRRERIELLCTHGYKSDVLGVLASRLLQIPIACFLRGWIAENYKVRLYEQVDRVAIRFADRIVCLSDSQAQRVAKSSKCVDKIRVVCNAIDVDVPNPNLRNGARQELCQRFNLPQNCLIAATAGRLSPEKGAGDFLEAVARIRDLPIRVRFLIFGEGVLGKSLQKRAESLKLQDRVIFAGFHADVRHLLPGIDLLVNPSLTEEMPNIVLEGMAARVPVVATHVGGVPDIAGLEESVHLVPPANPEVLASVIDRLLRNESLRESLAERGYRRAQQKFSLSAQRSQFHELYEGLLGPYPSQTPAVKGSINNERPIARTDGVAPFDQGDFVSVVVPVRNEESRIGSVLAGLAAQDYPNDRFEILVADGDSTDRTATLVHEFARRAPMSVRLLRNPRRLSSAGRNVGARNARGNFVVYVDGHCHIPGKTMLRDAVALFERTNADCLCRPQPLTTPGNTVFQDVVAHARATPLAHARDSTIYTTKWEAPVNPSSSGALYRREVFDRIGFFDERLDACEDVDFNYRVFKAGLRSFYSSKLAVLYEPRKDLASLWKQMLRYGQGRCRLIRKHPDAFTVSQIVPAAFLLWLIIGGIVSFASGRIFELFLLTVAVYAATVLAVSAGLAAKYGRDHLVIGPAVFVCVHVGLGAGFVKEAVFGRWPVRCRTKQSAPGATSLPAADPPS